MTYVSDQDFSQVLLKTNTHTFVQTPVGAQCEHVAPHRKMSWAAPFDEFDET